MNTTIEKNEPATHMETQPSESASSGGGTRRVAGLMAAVSALAAALVRLVPVVKAPNVAPVGALALFGGARLPLWQAFLAQFACMFISDLVLWKLFAWQPFDPFVYGSFGIYVLLGRLLRRTRSPWKIGTVSLVASLQFYLITNFGVWYAGIGSPNPWYPPTAAGLGECYLMGLWPYFGGTVAGDLGFSLVLFGAYDWLPAWIRGTKKAAVEEIAR